MATPPMPPPTWVAAAPDRLVSQQIDVLSAVFDRASGQTHLLAEPLPQILAVLNNAPGTSLDVANRLSISFDIEESDSLAQRISECLDELAALGLVVRVISSQMATSGDSEITVKQESGVLSLKQSKTETL